MYQQRKEPEAGTLRPSGQPWRPFTEEGATAPIEGVPADAGDAYVVVDEIIDGRVRLVAAPWPTLGADERPVFAEPGDELTRAFAEPSLTRILNRHRTRMHQTLRPLRIGDTFLVKGFDPNAPSRWQAVIDVTSAARPAARRAFLRAVAQPPPEGPALEQVAAPGVALPPPAPLPAPSEPQASSVAHPAV